ncbi:MAG: TRAP transporter small permease [Desulfobacteraceae bacterium]|nr:TRAP transporter small permease [Desulfobacteraceae bacterium]
MNKKGHGRKIYRTLEIFCGLLLFIAVGINLGEIVGRILFHTTYDFIIDLPVWITVWAMLLIAGPLIAENGHVSINFVINKLQGRAKLLLELFNITATLIYSFAITIGGFALVRMLYQKEAVFPRYIPIPKWIVELCIPLGMGIFTIISIIEFFKIIKKYK